MREGSGSCHPLGGGVRAFRSSILWLCEGLKCPPPRYRKYKHAIIAEPNPADAATGSPLLDRLWQAALVDRRRYGDPAPGDAHKPRLLPVSTEPSCTPTGARFSAVLFPFDFSQQFPF